MCICYGILGMLMGCVELIHWHRSLSRRAQIHRPLLNRSQLSVIFSPTAVVMKRAAVIGVFLGFASGGDAVKLNLLFVATTMSIAAHMIIQRVTLKGICASRFVLPSLAQSIYVLDLIIRPSLHATCIVSKLYCRRTWLYFPQ